jgi:hypothetical protein
MKSERRHELQHNELAEWLFRAGQRVKPYQNLILAVVVALAVALVGWTIWSRTAAARAATAWNELTGGLQNDSLDTLTRVAETYPNTPVGQMASLVTADFQLAEGCKQRFINRVFAQRALNTAINLYSAALRDCRSPSLLERATFGIARAKEAQGDLEAAAKYYGDIVTKWPEGAFAAAAKQRLADFKQRETKMMFDSLASFDPSPSFSDRPEMTAPSFGEGVPPEKSFDSLASPPSNTDKKEQK